MGKKFVEETVPICIRIPTATVKRAKEEAERLSATGMTQGYLDVLRLAMARGLDEVAKVERKGARK